MLLFVMKNTFFPNSRKRLMATLLFSSTLLYNQRTPEKRGENVNLYVSSFSVMRIISSWKRGERDMCSHWWMCRMHEPSSDWINSFQQCRSCNHEVFLENDNSKLLYECDTLSLQLNILTIAVCQYYFKWIDPFSDLRFAEGCEIYR